MELIVKHITSHCGSIAQTKEGAATKMAGTVAADGNHLDLFDHSDIVGPGFKGYHLRNSENERGWETAARKRWTPDWNSEK